MGSFRRSRNLLKKLSIVGKHNIRWDGGTDPTAFTSDFTATGDHSGFAVRLGNETGLTGGAVYFMSSSGDWAAAQADSTPLGATSMLAMAMSSTSGAGFGMLFNGFVRLAAANYDGVAALGAPAYLSDGSAGKIDFTQPADASEIVRVMGHCVKSGSAGDILFYFNPTHISITLG